MIRQRISLWQTFVRAVVPAAVLLVSSGFFLFAFLLPNQKETLLQAKEEACAQPVHVLLSQMATIEEDVRQGKLTQAEAQSMMLSRLRQVRFGSDGRDYFWIISPDARLIMHPFRKDYVERNPDSAIGPDKRPLRNLLQDMQMQGNQANGGYLDYLWIDRNDTMRETMKRAYVKTFQPWGWTVGTGMYLNEVEDYIGSLRTKLLLGGVLLALVVTMAALLLSFRAHKLHISLQKALENAESEQRRFRRLFDNSPNAIVISRIADRKIVEANHKALEIFSCTEAELIGKDFCALGWAESSLPICMDPDLSQTTEIKSLSLSLHNKEGSRQLLLSASIMESPADGENHQVSFLVDVTDRIRLAQDKENLEATVHERSLELQALDLSLREQKTAMDTMARQFELANQVYQNSNDAVVITKADGTILTVNPSFTMITGYTLEEVKGKNPNILKSGKHNREFYESMWNSLLESGRFSGEVFNRRKNGEIYPTLLTIHALKDNLGHITEYIAVSQDLTELRQNQDQVRAQDQMDRLTGLANQYSFEDLLRKVCEAAETRLQQIAVLHIGLDRFNWINKVFGFSSGDCVLQESARRIRGVMGEHAVVARLAGDEFGTWLVLEDGENGTVRLNQLQAELKRAFTLDQGEVVLGASTGVALFPEDGRRADVLLRHSLQAMERAKENRPGSVQYFTSDLSVDARKRIALEAGIRRAFEDDEFHVFFQPKVPASGGPPVGMEALMRWFPHDGKPIPPNEFIPVVEDIGEIDRLGLVALNQSCRWAKHWNAQGFPLRVSVNVSAQQLFSPGFVSQVLRTLEAQQMSGMMLELEVTESAVMQDFSRARKVMGSLINEGICFSLDDFGTGYSSLSHIRKLPIAGLKIDKSFIDDIAQNPETQAIVQMLTTLADQLTLEVTVEGVETLAQVEVLRSIRSDVVIQGYYFAKPMDPDAFGNYLSQTHIAVPG